MKRTPKAKPAPAPAPAPVPALITFGRGGHQVYFEPQPSFSGMSHQTTSGYRSPENFFDLRPSHRPDGPEARDHEPMDFQGVPVIDMRDAAGTKAGIHMSISGPMVQPGLKDRDVVECPTPSPMLAEGLAGTTFGSLIQVQAEQKANGITPGAFDMVSVPQYIRMWRRAGAKIGAVRGVAIEFEQPAKVVQGPTEEQSELLLADAGALKAPVVDEPAKVLATQSPSLDA